MKDLQVILVLMMLFIFSAVTNADQVKLFSEPAETSAIVKVLKLGDVVKVYGKSSDGQFYEIEHKGNHGYIIFKYLSPKDHRYSAELLAQPFN